MKSLLEVTSGDDAITEHADWLELRALFEKDGNVAQEDLVRAVVQAGWATEDRARQLAQDVFVEIEDRIVACNWGRNFAVYPFTLDRRRNLLIRRSKQASVQSRELLYLFLLVTARADMSAMARRLGGETPLQFSKKSVLMSYARSGDLSLVFLMGNCSGLHPKALEISQQKSTGFVRILERGMVGSLPPYRQVPVMEGWTQWRGASLQTAEPEA